MSEARASRWFVVAMASAARRVAADRAATLVVIGFYVVVVTAISSLWRGAAEANGGHVVGYSAVALTWYLVTSEASIVPMPMRMIETIGDDIASGAVAVELLRPAPVLGMRIASELGHALAKLVPMAAAGAALATLFAGAPPSWWGIALAVPSLVLALACNITLQHAVAAGSFWVRDARSLWFLYHKFVFILGGMLIPLQVLPEWLQTAAFALPFSAMAYAPARLASGHVEPWLLLVQCGWLAVSVAAAVVAFGAGQRRLQVVGG